ncbi:MAG: hypothetical protein JW740_03235 [Candidatus Zambryskibacteria bacterium]|nr:hypothetical protein [Candidatus Zambryskibacteria bacterium]
MVYNVYKDRGETPLECLERFVKNDPNLSEEKMTYLGRLDPLAEGVLLLGNGKDTKQENRERFFNLDKEYDFAAIFGFATDTYDVLGKVVKEESVEDINIMDVRKVAMIYEGKREQKYPKYSSKIISKKKILKDKESNSEFDLEKALIKDITIYQLELKRLETLTHKKLFWRLFTDISKVNGEFRQKEILALWKDILLKNPENKIYLGHFNAHVSSGTYIRSLVNDMGATLGCGATTLSIKRNRVGDYKIEDSIKIK